MILGLIVSENDFKSQTAEIVRELALKIEDLLAQASSRTGS